MLWCDFTTKLKKINKDLWVNVNQASLHEGQKIVGIFFGNDHVCSMTYDQHIPYHNKTRPDGVITHRGLKELAKFLLKYRNKQICLKKGVESYKFVPIANKTAISEHFNIDAYLINPEE